ncbi:MAG: IS3 family transposase, partial [Synechococcaceae cyanobacterium]
MARIDALYLEDPCSGSRRMVGYLARDGIPISRDCVRNLMRRMGLSSDIRFWSSGDTKTGPVDGLLMEALWRPLDRCFIGGCRVVVGGGGI